MVGNVAVGEDVEEELSARLEPAADAAHELSPVLHMLEHLDGNHPVEPTSFGGEEVHVLRDDADVTETALSALALDVGALGGGVGDGGDAGVRVVLSHPKGERTPATTEFEDFHTVGQLSPLTGECEHRFLGLGDGFCSRGVKAGGVF